MTLVERACCNLGSVSPIAAAALSDVPFRDTFWNIPDWAQFLLYALSVVAIGVFALGMWQRVALWREGKPEERLDRIPERVRFLIRHGLLQGRILTQQYPGVMHALMFWGFCVLFIGTVLATIDYDITLRLPLGLDFKLLQGPFYLLYELSLDLFGLFFVVGLGLALYRRFVLRPARIDPTAHFAWVLALLFVINVTGFVLEACRLAVVKPWWAPWSPVGWALGPGVPRDRDGRGGAPGASPRNLDLSLHDLVRIHRARSRTPTSST